jgi:aspartate racemase
MKKLGVIGGLGPEASAYFYHLFTKRAKVNKDQEHPDVFILSLPSIPDRTAYITGKNSKSPVEPLKAAARTLESLGVDFIVIPCVTSHFFYDEIAACISIPIIHIVRQTAIEIQRLGINHVGILATGGTLKSGFIPPILTEYGITAYTPGSDSRAILTRLIYDVLKPGFVKDSMSLFSEILRDPELKKAQKLMLACTELSLVKRDFGLDDFYIDPLEILVDQALALCKNQEG